MEKFTVTPPSTNTKKSSDASPATLPEKKNSDAKTIAEIRKQLELARKEKKRLEQEILRGDKAHTDRIERLRSEEEQVTFATMAKAKQAAISSAAAKGSSQEECEAAGNKAAAAAKAQEVVAKQAARDAEDDGLWKPPLHCVPICGDVRTINFDKLRNVQLAARGKLFDVITMDPPWQLASANPTRGVALGYSQLGDSLIEQIPVQKLQTDGFLFMWVINAKYKMALGLLRSWGYEFVDELTWVKQTVNRRVAKSHGFYLQHAKETCFVGRKGKVPEGCGNIGSDVIWSLRRGQSQKPEEQYVDEKKKMQDKQCLRYLFLFTDIYMCVLTKYWTTSNYYHWECVCVMIKLFYDTAV